MSANSQRLKLAGKSITVLAGLLLLLQPSLILANSPPPPVPDPTKFEKVLMPVFLNRPTLGWGRITWWSIFRVVNIGSDPVEYLSGRTTFCLLPSPQEGLAPMREQEVDILTSSSGTNPGVFFWIERSKLDDVLLSLRLYSSGNALTGGVEVPVVRESDLTTGPVQLFGLPGYNIEAPMTLRIYDFEAGERAEMLVRYFDSCSGSTSPVAEELVIMENFNSVRGRDYIPTQISLDVGPRIDHVAPQSLRIEIVPLTEGVKLWAFASVHTIEGHVSLFVPQPANRIVEPVSVSQ